MGRAVLVMPGQGWGKYADATRTKTLGRLTLASKEQRLSVDVLPWAFWITSRPLTRAAFLFDPLWRPVRASYLRTLDLDQRPTSRETDRARDASYEVSRGVQHPLEAAPIPFRWPHFLTLCGSFDLDQRSGF
jgi:hypothetical protein